MPSFVYRRPVPRRRPRKFAAGPTTFAITMNAGSFMVTGGSVRRDQLAPLYSGGSVRGDRLAPNAWQGAYRLDTLQPLCDLEGQRQDAPSPLSLPVVSRGDTLAAGGWLSVSRADRLVPLYWGGTVIAIQADTVVPLYTGGTLLRNTPTPVATSAPTQGGGSLGLAYLEGVRGGDYLVPLFWKSAYTAIQGDTSLPMAWLESVRQDATEPLETRRSVPSNNWTPLSTNGNSLGDTTVPSQNLRTATTSLTIPLSTASNIRQDTLLPVGSLVGERGDSTAPLGTLVSVTYNGAVVPISVLGAIALTELAPLYESSGTRSDTVLPLSWWQVLRADRALPVETTAAELIQDSAPLATTGSSETISLSTPVAWTALLRVDDTVSVTWLTTTYGIQADSSLPVVWKRGTMSSATVSLSLTGSVLAIDTLPLYYSWTSYYVTGRVLTMNVDGRTVYIAKDD